MLLEAFAPAKVNLALHVTGRRGDGYHLLDSIVVFAGVGDRLRVETAAGLSLSIGGPLAAGVPADGTNLVLRAAALMAGPGRGAEIGLEKHLPHGGGIGGGSSDAAAAIRVLARLWGAALPDTASVVALGADLPVCLKAPAPQRVGGIGEDVAPLPDLPDMHLVLVNPGIPVPTAQVFARLGSDAGRPGLTSLPAAADFGAFAAWLSAQRNDLEAPATAIAPAIAQALAALRTAPGCRLARMSGSGSTVFGLFPDAALAEGAARRLASEPGWWVRAARVLTPADRLLPSPRPPGTIAATGG